MPVENNILWITRDLNSVFFFDLHKPFLMDWHTNLDYQWNPLGIEHKFDQSKDSSDYHTFSQKYQLLILDIDLSREQTKKESKNSPWIDNPRVPYGGLEFMANLLAPEQGEPADIDPRQIVFASKYTPDHMITQGQFEGQSLGQVLDRFGLDPQRACIRSCDDCMQFKNKVDKVLEENRAIGLYDTPD